MIDDNTLIKFVRGRGYKEDWPERVITMKERLREMRLGFPGIRNEHLSLVPFNTIEPGEIFIWDNYLEGKKRGDEAPIMLRVEDMNVYYIMGIGCGTDTRRDPDRLFFRYGNVIKLPPFAPDFLVCRVDVRPTLNGGPGYYYFYKSYRDYRL